MFQVSKEVFPNLWALGIIEVVPARLDTAERSLEALQYCANKSMKALDQTKGEKLRKKREKKTLSLLVYSEDSGTPSCKLLQQ